MRTLITALMFLFASAAPLMAADLIIPAPEGLVPGVVSKSPFTTAKKIFLPLKDNEAMLWRKKPVLTTWAIVANVRQGDVPPEDMDYIIANKLKPEVSDAQAEAEFAKRMATPKDNKFVRMGTKFYNPDCNGSLFLEPYRDDATGTMHPAWRMSIQIRIKDKICFLSLWECVGTQRAADYGQFVNAASSWARAILEANGGVTQMNYVKPPTGQK